MKVNVYSDEMYPVWYASLPENCSCGETVDIPKELWDEYLEVNDHWYQIQDKIEMVYNDNKQRLLLEKCQKVGIQPKGF